MDWASLSSLCVCLLLMYACRLCIAPMWVLVKTPLSQCGVVWVVRIPGVLAGLSRRVSSFANWSTISLSTMPVCVLTFCIVILCTMDHVIWLTKAMMRSLSRWLCWDDGCRTRLFITCILLRVYVKMRVFCLWYCVLLIGISMALKFSAKYVL